MALYLEDIRLLSKFSSGDVVSNELFYHKACYKTFFNRYKKAKLQETNLEKNELVRDEEYMKALYFNQVTNYIYQCFKTDSKIVFEVK